MATYVVLSRLSPEAFRDPSDFTKLAKAVSAAIKEQCPDLKWKESYATLGRFDVIDVVEADDPKQIERAAMIIRAYGHPTTETLAATPWKEFFDSLSKWVSDPIRLWEFSSSNKTSKKQILVGKDVLCP